MEPAAAYDAVMKRRTARDLSAIHRPNGLGDWVAVAGAERALGWADHGALDSISWVLAAEALDAAVPKLASQVRLQLRTLCVEAVFDGYDLATTLTGVTPSGNGRAYKNESALRKFQEKSARGGEALLKGPVAEVATRLLQPWLKRFPRTKQKPALLALANALAGGIQIHFYEHQKAHPSFAGVLPVPVKRPAVPPPTHVVPREDFIARIVAEPDRDEPRLVYADWLTEQGDPLGELIQVQCALAKGASGAERSRLEEREEALLHKHRARWSAPLRPYMMTERYERGFITEVQASTRRFLHGAAKFAQVPLERLKLQGFRPSDAKGFAATVALPALKLLDLSDNRLDKKSVAIVSSPLFRHAPVLRLKGNPLEAAGVERLAALLNASTWALDLDLTHLGPNALRALAPLKVTHLSLRRNRFAGADLDALQRLERLEWLDLGQNELGNAGAARVARLTFPRLKYLDVSDNRIGPAGLAALAASPTLKPLEVLDYTQVRLDAATQDLIARRFGKNETPADPFRRNTGFWD